MRKAFSMCFGDNWYIQEAARPYIELAATPSVLYDKFLVHMNGWSSPDLTPIVKSSLIVHLTGGSFRGKFWEDFLKRHGFSAVLDDLYDPPEIMQLGGEWRGFKSSGFYDTFHGGRIKITDKPKLRDKLKRSTDRADALALTFMPLMRATILRAMD